MISPVKHRRLKRRMKQLGIRAEDVREKFIRGSGKGGQKINTTAACVQLRHAPSGIEIRCQKTRSRADNRFFARRRLCDKLEELTHSKKSARRKKIEKIRRRKRRRSRRAKKRMLDFKHKRKQKKRRRNPVDFERD